jgi:hypothetical protein
MSGWILHHRFEYNYVWTEALSHVVYPRYDPPQWKEGRRRETSMGSERLITRLRVFISSPGDVSEERALSVQVFERLARECADAVEIQVVLWEHEPLFGHAHFQDQIERPSQCDLVVHILWSRLGTRLPSTFVLVPGKAPPTGTEFEERDALEAFRRLGKQNLLIYRKTSPPHVNLPSGKTH